MSAKIRLLVLDVDGTLTDGSIFLDGSGNEFKRFHVRDGMGIHRLRASGVETAILSGRYSASTARRAGELGIHLLFNGVKDKLRLLVELAEKLGMTRDEIAYVGDDLNDLDCIPGKEKYCSSLDLLFQFFLIWFQCLNLQFLLILCHCSHIYKVCPALCKCRFII